MPFSAGDILLKIDLRATADTILTRHHVMLVIGETAKGHPVVAHMLAAPEWKLIKEELTRGNKLTLIHFPWPEETRAAITKAANDALACDKFQISRKIIEEQVQEVTPFRPECSLEAKRKLEELHKTFSFESKTYLDFSPSPAENKIMSCHEWVLSIIHYACRQTKVSIPLGLQIPPHLAWADRLCYSSKNDPFLSCTTVTIRPPASLEEIQHKRHTLPEIPIAIIQLPKLESTMRRAISLFSFFYPQKIDRRAASEILMSTLI